MPARSCGRAQVAAKYRIRVILGDRSDRSALPYDLSHGMIVFRAKGGSRPRNELRPRAVREPPRAAVGGAPDDWGWRFRGAAYFRPEAYHGHANIMATAKSDDDGDERQSHLARRTGPAFMSRVVATFANAKWSARGSMPEAASAAPRAESAPGPRAGIAGRSRRALEWRRAQPAVAIRGCAGAGVRTRSLGPGVAPREYAFDSAKLNSMPPVEVVPCPAPARRNTKSTAPI